MTDAADGSAGRVNYAILSDLASPGIRRCRPAPPAGGKDPTRGQAASSHVFLKVLLEPAFERVRDVAERTLVSDEIVAQAPVETVRLREARIRPEEHAPRAALPGVLLHMPYELFAQSL